MRYRTIGKDPKTRREVSVLSLGAMLFGTATDEATSFAILDRYVEAGGTFIDSSNNYAFWNTGSQGGQSEELLGRWRRSRGVGDEVVATKLGARPLARGTSFADAAKPNSVEGLSAKAIRESAERSRERLGMARLHLLYAHIRSTGRGHLRDARTTDDVHLPSDRSDFISGDSVHPTHLAANPKTGSPVDDRRGPQSSCSSRPGRDCPVRCVTGRDGFHGQLAAWMRSP